MFDYGHGQARLLELRLGQRAASTRQLADSNLQMNVRTLSLTLIGGHPIDIHEGKSHVATSSDASEVDSIQDELRFLSHENDLDILVEHRRFTLCRL
jgi:hypothetical protein